MKDLEAGLRFIGTALLGAFIAVAAYDALASTAMSDLTAAIGAMAIVIVSAWVFRWASDKWTRRSSKG